MNATRIIVCLVLAVGYAAYRGGVSLPPLPVPAVVPAAKPFPEVAAAAAGLTAGDRESLAQAYDILSRSVAANPEVEPVFVDTASIRKAHRAALLTVWRGVLDNKEGQVPGLRAALEGALQGRVGVEDVPLNPTLQRTAAQAFADLAASLR